MAMQLGGSDEFNSEINVTPMVDVMLVLLIIFMIVTPLLQQGVSVNLPREMISPDEDADIAKDTSVVIAIPDNNNFYIGNQEAVSYRLELGDVIKLDGWRVRLLINASFTSRAAWTSITDVLLRQ